ncbi:MAG: trehalose-phosphatase [Candidatus Omnitrophica bacterium]|nr:trehalose-phosphatase [Candidatus Omnitrophota bacterium]MCB9747125.1 trehalose-phosphatase [Candidatus Omnitrophota bacterium]
MVQKKEQTLDFFKNLDEIKKRLSLKEIFVFLDYDGTLTPIVATPDLAILSKEMHDKIKILSQKRNVAIVSGRATDDVKDKVKIDGIFYAGSHGFEIVTPHGDVKINQQAKNIKNDIDSVYKELLEKLKEVSGSLVEHVKYTISVHYRLVEEKDFSKVEIAVNDIIKRYPNLRKTKGKKVFEIRPDIDWDKGKAVEWILGALKFDAKKQIAIYIGDDTTDEDAFKVLKDKGFGILVSENARETKAEYRINDTEEVKKALDFLIEN